MKLTLATAAAILSYASSAAAHGGVTSWSVGSTTYQGWQPFLAPTGQSTVGRPYSSYDPILNPTAATIHCNNDGSTGPAPKSISIAAGQELTAYWPQWTHAEGPITVYLSRCPGTDCSSYSSSGAKWFKIAEAGLLSGTLGAGKWANGQLMANLKWTAKIPATLQPGPYLVRFETLALHQANTPQFYPECAQLQVTGSGTAFPSNAWLVSIPGAWTATDPGVKVDIYSAAAKTETKYIIPGPPVWDGSSGGTPPTTVAPPPPTTTGGSSPTTTPVGPTIPKYGQCGGIGWTGGTVCASGSTCTKSNDYYSQCL